ncbi:MAG: hypothetical protein BZY79_05745 [SAR202 cluster bacterium Casp-Chloro-G4]|nr:glycosyltransferase family 2 protein [Chloroflexota bacterium]MDA1226497.1 glycosyltransferase family 2 protein [Chloroflexota bacterium]PKB61060.1 MAG: hypothetical protein BZY79_05745 [SAR202 cluster bacterium Casp-Chloro-G4]
MLASIIICSYNSADTLDGALYSALTQDFPSDEFEVLLVDDGSTDETVELAASYEKKHGNLRYLRLPLNKGKPAAWERGFQTARGKYFTSLDSGDALHPRMLRECVAALELDVADLAYCDYHEVTLADNSHKHIRMDCFDPVGIIGRAAVLRMDIFSALPRPSVSISGWHDVYQRYIKASERQPIRVPQPLYFRCPQSPESDPGRGSVDSQKWMPASDSNGLLVVQGQSPAGKRILAV